jgi:hypothetical protein
VTVHSAKYSTADTQILATKGQILKVAVSGVSAFVSTVLMGSPLNFYLAASALVSPLCSVVSALGSEG